MANGKSLMETKGAVPIRTLFPYGQNDHEQLMCLEGGSGAESSCGLLYRAMKIFLVCGVASDAERNQAMLLFRELSARGNEVTLLGESKHCDNFFSLCHPKSIVMLEIF